MLRRKGTRWIAVVVCFGSWGAIASLAHGLGLSPGDQMPTIAMTSIDGTPVDTSKLSGKPIVIMFGNTSQDRTRRAHSDIQDILKDPRLKDADVQWILLCAGTELPVAIEARDGEPRPVLIHDQEREVFGMFKVIALPSTIIVDPEGIVSGTTAGYSIRFKERVRTAILAGAGLSNDGDGAEDGGQGVAAPPSESDLRAERLVHFGEKLLEQGLTELGKQKLREAVDAAPGSLHPLLVLARVLVGEGEWEEAGELFARAAVVDPDSSEAAFGEVYCGAQTGAVDAARAESLALRLLEGDPESLRGHYLLGVAHEQRGEASEAAREFRLVARWAIYPPAR